MTENLIFSTHVWSQGAKWKFCVLTAHLQDMQDMPNHILEYQLSSPENVDEVQVTNFTDTKSYIFRPSFDPAC